MTVDKHPKVRGERGVICTAAEFTKLEIPVSIPLSDNLPYDLVIDYAGRLWKVQVKASTCSGGTDGSVVFSLQTNNWYSKTTKRYTSLECDLMVCYDLIGDIVYILGPDEFVGRSGITICKKEGRQKQRRNMHNDLLLTMERLDKLTMPPTPNGAAPDFQNGTPSGN